MIRRTLNVPHVALTREDFNKIAGRFETIAAEDVAARRAQMDRDYRSRFPRKAERDAKIDEMLGYRYPLPAFTASTHWGQASAETWHEVLNEVEPRDVESVRIRSKSDRVELEATFHFAGLAAIQYPLNEIRAASESAEHVRQEIAFFNDLFDRRRSPLRAVGGHLVTLFVSTVLAFLAGGYGVTAALVWLGADAGTARSLGVISGVLIAAAWVPILFAMTPRITVEGLGPARRLAGVALWAAGALVTVALGVVGSLIAAAITT